MFYFSINVLAKTMPNMKIVNFVCRGTKSQSLWYNPVEDIAATIVVLTHSKKIDFLLCQIDTVDKWFIELCSLLLHRKYHAIRLFWWLGTGIII